ncbi:MAG: hypothetical protein ACE5OZ_09735 [Candidatus Heimdallarchaeota archaeon]
MALSEYEPTKKLSYGLVSGIIGGLAMLPGLIMMEVETENDGKMSMLESLSLMMGDKDLLMGLLIHMMVAIIYGVIFGVVILLYVSQFGKEHPNLVQSVGIGLVYAVVLQIIAAMGMMVMPSEIDPDANDMLILFLGQFMGHLVYGAVTGLAYSLLNEYVG